MTKFLRILALGWLITLTGCVTCPEIPPKPAKPHIEMIILHDGGIALDRTNTERLARYILQLELGYD